MNQLYGVNTNKSDEMYTPRYGVLPILPHIAKLEARLQKKLTIWCPFDTLESEFVKVLYENGYTVICTHIYTGHDFFSYRPNFEWDIMVSNPPFSNKKDIFKRALAFGKPIALIMTLAWLNDSGSKLAFSETGRKMQLLMFLERMNFIRGDGLKHDSTPSFSSAYYCSDFLEEDIVIESLKKYKEK